MTIGKLINHSDPGSTGVKCGIITLLSSIKVAGESARGDKDSHSQDKLASLWPPFSSVSPPQHISNNGDVLYFEE